MSSNLTPPEARPVVTFVTRSIRDRWADVDSLGSPNDHPERFRSGVETWIIQTYLELKAIEDQLPFRVAVAAKFPKNQPAIAHRDDLRAVALYYRSYLAETRADRGQVEAAHWHLVQNPTQISANGILLPFWPQPGMIKRDPNRKKVETISFFGRSDSMPGFFRNPEFTAELQKRSIRFLFSERNWHDYSGTDLCLALRYDPEIGSDYKPFSKLVNAWTAGTPALLGPESAFRSLRRTDLDYIEINSGRDILAAIDRLQNETGLYAAMVDNGFARAREFTREKIRAQWITFIESQFLPGWKQWQRNRPGEVRRLLAFLSGLQVQRRERTRFKQIEQAQREAIAASGIAQRF